MTTMPCHCIAMCATIERMSYSFALSELFRLMSDGGSNDKTWNFFETLLFSRNKKKRKRNDVRCTRSAHTDTATHVGRYDFDSLENCELQNYLLGSVYAVVNIFVVFVSSLQSIRALAHSFLIIFFVHKVKSTATLPTYQVKSHRAECVWLLCLFYILNGDDVSREKSHRNISSSSLFAFVLLQSC